VLSKHYGQGETLIPRAAHMRSFSLLLLQGLDKLWHFLVVKNPVFP